VTQVLSVSIGFYALMVLWLLCPVPVRAMGCDGEGVGAGEGIRSVKVLALEYPMGISFQQWLERGDSKLTCKLFQRLNLTPDFVLMPFRRAVAEMEAGNADMMVGTNYIFEPGIRCQMKMIVYRYYTILAYYYAESPRLREPTTLKDFIGKRIVTVDRKLFNRLTGLEDVEVITVAEVVSKFTVLRLGRADYVLEEAGEIDKLQREAQALPGETGQFFTVSTPFSTAYTGLVVNIRRPGMKAFAEVFARELGQLRKEDSFRVLTQGDNAYLNRTMPHSILLSEYPERMTGTVCNGVNMVKP